MPEHIKAKLEKALQATISDPALAKRLQDAGFDAQWTAAAKYADLVKADTAELGPIAKANHITASN